jgi:hypothetical protein
MGPICGATFGAVFGAICGSNLLPFLGLFTSELIT